MVAQEPQATVLTSFSMSHVIPVAWDGIPVAHNAIRVSHIRVVTYINGRYCTGI